MKIKTQPRIVDSTNKTSVDIVKQLQAMTDDVRGILQGGLSFSDAQLPFQYREVTVTSGKPTVLTIQSPYSILGCIPIQTYGAVISGFQSAIVNNKFNVTITMDLPTSTIGFLLVGS